MQGEARQGKGKQGEARLERERRRAPVESFPHHSVRSPSTRVLLLSLCQVPRTDTHPLPLLSLCGVFKQSSSALSDLCEASLCSSVRVEQLDCVSSSHGLSSSSHVLSLSSSSSSHVLSSFKLAVSSSLQGQVLCELPPSL